MSSQPINAVNFDQFIMVPFKSLGRDYSGCDCWGQIYLVYRDLLNITLETYEGIPATNLREVSRLIALHKLTWERVEVPQKFDVVILKTQASESLVSHVGVMISNTHLLHTEDRIGARIVKVTDPFMEKRIIEYRRHRLLQHQRF